MPATGCSTGTRAPSGTLARAQPARAIAGVIDDVQEARSANPELRVLIASGYTDLITPYLASTYLVGQLPTLPRAAPIQIENYAAWPHALSQAGLAQGAERGRQGDVRARGQGGLLAGGRATELAATASGMICALGERATTIR